MTMTLSKQWFDQESYQAAIKADCGGHQARQYGSLPTITTIQLSHVYQMYRISAAYTLVVLLNTGASASSRTFHGSSNAQNVRVNERDRAIYRFLIRPACTQVRMTPISSRLNTCLHHTASQPGISYYLRGRPQVWILDQLGMPPFAFTGRECQNTAAFLVQSIMENETGEVGRAVREK